MPYPYHIHAYAAIYVQKQRTPKISLRGSESGGYLLSHNKCSTIGVIELNDPVRNGKGWDLNAITTLIISLVFRNEYHLEMFFLI